MQFVFFSFGDRFPFKSSNPESQGRQSMPKIPDGSLAPFSEGLISAWTFLSFMFTFEIVNCRIQLFTSSLLPLEYSINIIITTSMLTSLDK